MPLHVKVNVDLSEGVTLRDLREFVAEADRIGAPDDVDLREYNLQDDLVGLEAVGGTAADRAAE